MKKFFAKLSQFSIAFVLASCCFTYPVSIQASTANEAIPKQVEEVLKQQIYNSFPEKFHERSLETLTLEEMEARSGSHGNAVKHGNPVTNSKTYIKTVSSWAKIGNSAEIQFTKSKEFSVSFNVEYKFNLKGNASGSVNYASMLSTTFPVAAYANQVCAVAVFADVTAQEWTTYIYDNYSGHLISTQNSTVRSVRKSWYEGVYDGQVVTGFFHNKITL